MAAWFYTGKLTSLVQSTTNGHKQSCSNGATDGNELDLTVTKMTLQVVGVIGH
jgi:hypothetical protein